jgi:hypothetical protein
MGTDGPRHPQERGLKSDRPQETTPRPDRRKMLSGLRKVLVEVSESDLPRFPSTDDSPDGCQYRDKLINRQNCPNFGTDLPFDRNGKVTVFIVREDVHTALFVPQFTSERLGSKVGEYRPADLALIYSCAGRVFREIPSLARIICVSERIQIAGLYKLAVVTRLWPLNTQLARSDKDDNFYKEEPRDKILFSLDTVWQQELWHEGAAVALVKNE